MAAFRSREGVAAWASSAVQADRSATEGMQEADRAFASVADGPYQAVDHTVAGDTYAVGMDSAGLAIAVDGIVVDVVVVVHSERDSEVQALLAVQVHADSTRRLQQSEAAHRGSVLAAMAAVRELRL